MWEVFAILLLFIIAIMNANANANVWYEYIVHGNANNTYVRGQGSSLAGVTNHDIRGIRVLGSEFLKIIINEIESFIAFDACKFTTWASG